MLGTTKSPTTYEQSRHVDQTEMEQHNPMTSAWHSLPECRIHVISDHGQKDTKHTETSYAPQSIYNTAAILDHSVIP